MQFQNPQMIYGFLALLIPIIIHLFNLQRYKKVVFSTVRFLKEAQKNSKQKVKLKSWLLLLTRCLFLSVLVLCFMDPVIPNENGQTEDSYDVLVDNSGSMHEVNSTGSSLVQYAQEQLRTVFKEDQITLSPFIDVLDDTKASKVLIASDLQIGSMSSSAFEGDVDILRIPNKSKNILFDSVWFSKPMVVEGDNEFNIRLKNKGDVTAVKLSVSINGVLMSSVSEKLLAAEEKVLVSNITLTKGVNKIELSINDKGYKFDNKFYLSCVPQLKVPVAVMGEESSVISKVLRNEELFDVRSFSFSNYNPEFIETSSIVFVDDFRKINKSFLTNLKDYALQGGHVFVALDTIGVNKWNEVFPQFKASNKVVSEFFESQLNLESPLLKGVLTETKKTFDEPKFKQNYATAKASEVYMKVPGLGNVLSSYNVGNGKVYVLGTALETSKTNLHKHAILVPLLYNMVFNSIKGNQIYARLGESVYAFLDTLQAGLTVDYHDQIVNVMSREINGVNVLAIPNEIEHTGIFEVVKEERSLGALAFNYPKEECEPAYLSDEEVQSFFPNAQLRIFEVEDANGWQAFANNFAENTPLWKYCVILSLLFLLIEIVLIRLY